MHSAMVTEIRLIQRYRYACICLFVDTCTISVRDIFSDDFWATEVLFNIIRNHQTIFERDYVIFLQKYVRVLATLYPVHSWYCLFKP